MPIKRSSFLSFQWWTSVKIAVKSNAFDVPGILGIKSNIKSHSFFATYMYASMLNINDEEIKRLGRWFNKGETHKRYIRLNAIIP